MTQIRLTRVLLLALALGACSSTRRLGEVALDCECTCLDSAGEEVGVFHDARACGDGSDAVDSEACSRACQIDGADPTFVTFGGLEVTGITCHATAWDPPSVSSGCPADVPLLAAQPPSAIHSVLSPAESFAVVTAADGSGGSVPLTGGEVWAVIPNGRSVDGPIRITWLTVFGDKFTIGNHEIDNFSSQNDGILEGLISAANNFTLPTGAVNAQADIDGTLNSDRFPAPSPQFGYIDYLAGVMVFQGTYANSDGSIDFYLVYHFAPGGVPPQPVITVTPATHGTLLLDASQTVDDGGGVDRVIWFRHYDLPRPQLIGTGITLLVNPGHGGANAITAVVHSRDGQAALASVCLHPGGCTH